MSAASTGSTSTTVIKLAIGLTCVVASTGLTMLVMSAIETPAKIGVSWLDDRFGTAGLLAAMGLTFAAFLSFARWATRRDRRRQYEADRTIHVVPRRKIPKWIWYYVGAIVIFVLLMAAAPLLPPGPGATSRSGTPPALQTR